MGLVKVDNLVNELGEVVGIVERCVCGHKENRHNNEYSDGVCFREYSIREWDGSFGTVHLFPLQDREEKKADYISRIEKLGKVTLVYRMGWKSEERNEVSTPYAQSILTQPR